MYSHRLQPAFKASTPASLGNKFNSWRHNHNLLIHYLIHVTYHVKTYALRCLFVITIIINIIFNLVVFLDILVDHFPSEYKRKNILHVHHQHFETTVWLF